MSVLQLKVQDPKRLISSMICLLTANFPIVSTADRFPLHTPRHGDQSSSVYLGPLAAGVSGAPYAAGVGAP